MTSFKLTIAALAIAAAASTSAFAAGNSNDDRQAVALTDVYQSQSNAAAVNSSSYSDHFSDRTHPLPNGQ